VSEGARPPPGARLCALSEIADPGAKGFRFREGPAMFAGLVVRLKARSVAPQSSGGWRELEGPDLR